MAVKVRERKGARYARGATRTITPLAPAAFSARCQPGRPSRATAFRLAPLALFAPAGPGPWPS